MILQQPYFLLLLPLALYAVKIMMHEGEYSTKIGISRTVVLSLLVLAAASPAFTQVKESTTDQKLTVLEDNTTSTEVLQDSKLPEEADKRVFASGNTSRIFSNAATMIEQGSYNVLVTDGQTEESTEDIIQTAREKNATVSIYTPETKKESAVRIEGPSTTVPGAQNEYTLKISSTHNTSIPANLSLDGETIFSGEVNESYSFTHKFQDTGEHALQAHTASEDIFNRNNHYYKTVEVGEKPDILSIGSTGLLETKLDQFYDIENRESLPQDLSSYYTVLMKKPVENERLNTYIANGNGLVYTGRMRETVPGYLPVRKASGDEESSGAKVVILIDASVGVGDCDSITSPVGSQVCTKDTAPKAKESLQIAYSLVDTLKKSNRVGVVAYNDYSYLVSEPKSLAYNREQIKDKIASISPSGPSYHDLGVRGAAQLAEENDTVVMLSDGNIGSYPREDIDFKTRSEAAAMEAKLITVGMGSDPNKPLLESIAKDTGGYYLENSEAGRLNFKFGTGGGGSEYTPLKIVNPQHFITRDISLDGDTTDFKPVDTKRAAKKLVAGSNGADFLSTWRYGLGRVAAFSAGQKNLDRTVKSDPAVISRSVSWAVGNPHRKKEEWLDVRDARRPNNPRAEASYPAKSLREQSRNLYAAQITAPELGIHNWRNETYAYNYNAEIEKVGFRQDKLQNIAIETGGMFFDSENIGELPEELSEVDKDIRTRVSLSPFLIAAALLIFLVEIGYRKMNGRL